MFQNVFIMAKVECSNINKLFLEQQQQKIPIKNHWKQSDIPNDRQTVFFQSILSK